MLKIDEVTERDGTISSVVLVRDGDALCIAQGGGTFAVPEGVLEAAMRRYGLPFDTTERVAVVGDLELAAGRRLRHVRHLARYDVIARDYLVLEAPDQEPLCALAVTVAAALSFVARGALS
jgi:hypothetical protein